MQGFATKSLQVWKLPTGNWKRV